jgi:hypothetical protein
MFVNPAFSYHGSVEKPIFDGIFQRHIQGNPTISAALIGKIPYVPTKPRPAKIFGVETVAR